MQCLVTSGDLPIDFKWYFNGRPVKEYSGITTVKLGNRNSVLNIDSVTGKHAGNYTCQASNLADLLNFTAELIVKGTHVYMQLYQNDIQINQLFFLLEFYRFFCYSVHVHILYRFPPPVCLLFINR